MVRLLGTLYGKVRPMLVRLRGHLLSLLGGRQFFRLSEHIDPETLVKNDGR